MNLKSETTIFAAQFNDLPDELVEVIMNYGLPIVDRRSRILAQERVRALLVAHEHVSIVTERLMAKVSGISNSFLQYHTFVRELKQCLSPEQLKEIPLFDRIRLMGLRAQENQDRTLAEMAISAKCLLNADFDDMTQLANSVRTQFQAGRFDAIAILCLSYRKIISIPDEIIQLSSLQILKLSNNQLTSIPAILGRLTNLRELHLDFNQLTFVPDSLGQLTNLQILHLNNNQLTSVPASLGQLSSLAHLYLYINQLTTVPDSLGQLIELRSLNLGFNRLTSIPDSFGQLTNLTMLVLTYNQLTTIPDTLGQLTNLRELYLDHNRLTVIPKALWQLTSLVSLSLYQNGLTYIPASLLKLRFGDYSRHESQCCLI